MSLSQLNEFIWGPWMLVFIVGTGIILSCKLKFLPLKNLGYGFHLFTNAFCCNNSKKSTLEPIMTSLAAMMGTGNILGVSTALLLGGPGALFWMIVAALIGMTIAYAENMLAIKYQRTDNQGNYYGGPMYVIMQTNIPFKKIIAGLFSLFTIGASIGMGNLIQSNCAANELKETFGIPTLTTGLILGALALTVFLSQTTSIGKVCTYLVPIMSIIYCISVISIIIINRANIFSVVETIIKMAFYPKSILGGVSGTVTITFLSAVRWGMARGIFSNEAGMGSSAIALASSNCKEPVKQGYLSMINVFIDTIIMCTLTGLAILTSEIDGVSLTGTKYIHQVFTTILGNAGGYIITLCIVLFAFATIIGWAFYGKIALKFFVSKESNYSILYSIFYSLMIVIGAISATDNIWNVSDIFNALMIIPNLICLLSMRNEIAEDTTNFEKKKSSLERRTSHYRARRFLK